MKNKIALVLGLFTIVTVKSQNTVRPASEIFSDFNGYWRSSNNAVIPNNNHNLLAFTWNANGINNINTPITYSTGVNNSALSSNNIPFTSATFISLPIYTIPSPGSGTFIGVGQAFGGNGNVTPVPVNNNLVQYLTDGINGLGLGTAIFNIPQGSNIAFNTMGIVPTSIGDGVPDLIFTQMGQPSSTSDVFHFQNGPTPSDPMVGTPYSVAFGAEVNGIPVVPSIGNACWKFYRANVSPPLYDAGTSSGCTRNIRVIALDWSEMGITTANYQSATTLIQTYSGTSDPAFIGAYNAASITFASTFSGTVFNDNNAGTPDGNGYQGATVKLFNNGVEIGSKTTDVNGYYYFDNININTYPGPYTIQLTEPTGFNVVGNKVGTTANSFTATISNSISSGNNFGINQPPVAVDDNASVGKNMSKTFSIVTNDYDLNSGSLIYSTINLIAPSGATNIITSGGYTKGFIIAGQGTWLVDNLGNLTFTPAIGFFGNATTVNYNIKDLAGLTSNNASIFIAVDYCIKPGASGIPDGYSKVGITTLKTRNKNWPEGPTINEGGVPNGFIALESNTKGLVITKTTSTANIINPQKGMIAYDITDQCIKLYNGTTWKCIKRACND
ncbi:Ig-like domain-containing protein [Chryseobacterium gambrini]|uniref:Ig-like domain-containing protein n=2 Tax=Weeksellaceae TaxID=2762318 RepID=A0AAJ1VL25_9FLAO|nr:MULTISPECIES: Ig-like domain-containing protein [Chryseobacterium]MDN4014238.1 Ig-like domain-containing protein [Chryseobacterium gambrini]PZU18903.1 MAG: hypothetical protein DI622_09415 [Chryseobacterium sp.]QWA37149.1 hypothetical protein KKI44_14555 [Chryseobacterium sp. ZHDP1]